MVAHVLLRAIEYSPGQVMKSMLTAYIFAKLVFTGKCNWESNSVDWQMQLKILYKILLNTCVLSSLGPSKLCHVSLHWTFPIRRHPPTWEWAFVLKLPPPRIFIFIAPSSSSRKSGRRTKYYKLGCRLHWGCAFRSFGKCNCNPAATTKDQWMKFPIKLEMGTRRNAAIATRDEEEEP